MHYDNKDIGNKVIIQALKDIDNKHGGDITIIDAITKLVEQRFDSHERELAFAFLTGLMRTVNRERESYCYKPFTNTDLHSFAGVEKEQQVCDVEQKQAATRYANVEYVADDDNQVEFESGDWLPLSKNDYLLKTPKPQQKNNETNCCVINDNNKSQLHADWNSIISEMEKVDEGQDKVNNTHSISFGKRSLTTTEKMLRAAIGFSVVLMCAQGVNVLSISERNVAEATSDIYNATEITTSIYNATGEDTDIDDITETSTASYPRIITIDDVIGLNMIGKNESYPAGGSYQLINSFNAESFAKSISDFNGSFDGNNNTIRNLKKCLFTRLIGNSIVKNLVIINADINNNYESAMIAKSMKNNATVANITIAYSNLRTNNLTGCHYGMVAASMTGMSLIDGITIAHCNITGAISSYGCSIGGVAGFVSLGPKVMNVFSLNLDINILQGEYVDIGGVVGTVSYRTKVENVIYPSPLKLLLCCQRSLTPVT